MSGNTHAGLEHDAQEAPITENSTLLAAPRSTEDHARAYIAKRGTIYNPHDIELIVGYYWKYARPANLDPLLVVAQCIHETSEQDPATGKWRPISSWWSQRPRRNPAGLGVTGQTRSTAPPDPNGWEKDDRRQPPIWRAGLRFSTWEDAARAHIGRLLAYAIPANQGTESQRTLIDFAMSVRPLPAMLRGSTSTLKMLGAKHNPTGHGWADPGVEYGKRIAKIAQEIKEVQV